MENYIMTAIETDVQFVDNMADASVNNPEYMTDEESLTIDEMYRLNTLEVGETFEMGVHFGFVTFTRMT